MRWNTGRHTNGNTFRTVYKDIWDLDRQYDRLFFRLIKVRHKIHNVFVQIFQKSDLCDLLQSGFRITHGSGAVSFDRTEVTVSVYQRKSFLEILCHDNKCVIDGAVSVWMIFTHCITDNTGGFTIRLVISNPQLLHIVQGSSLYRLQTVSDVRQSSCNDNRHRIIDIVFFHNFRIFCLYDFFAHVSPSFG